MTQFTTRTLGRSNILSLWLRLIFVALVAVGCGSSHGNDIYVHGNSGVPVTPGSTGNLAFRFAQAQDYTGVVPRGTTSLQFDFFDKDDKVIFFAQSDYAASVTVSDVPLSATKVTVTAYGAGGIPVASLSAPVKPLLGTTTVVDLSTATLTAIKLEEVLVEPNSISLDLQTSPTQQIRASGRFSNGTNAVLNSQPEVNLSFQGFDSSVIQVSPEGLVTGQRKGETGITVTATVNGQTVAAPNVAVSVEGTPPPIGRLLFTPSSLSVLSGESAAVKVTYFAPGSTTGFDVTHLTLGSSSNASANYTQGTVTTDLVDAPFSSTITVLYKDGDTEVSGTFTTQVTTPAPPPVPKGILQVQPETLTIRADGLLGLLSGELSSLGFFEATFIPNGQTQGYDVTSAIGVSFKDFFPATVTSDSFSYLYLGGRGTVMTTNPLGPVPPVGSRCTMTVTYIEDGIVYNKDVALTIGEPELERVEFLGTTNHEILLPAFVGTKYTVKAIAHFSNGYYEPLEFDDEGIAQTWEFDEKLQLIANPSDGFEGAEFDSQSDENRDIALTVQKVGQPKIYGSATLMLRQGLTAARVDISPSTIIVNKTGTYSVYLTYNDGSRLDLTAHWPVQEEGDDLFETFFDSCGCGSILPGQIWGLEKGESELSLVDSDSLVCVEIPDLDNANIGENAKVIIQAVSSGLIPLI